MSGGSVSVIGAGVAVALFFGIIAGMIGYTKQRTTSTFVAFFLLGALFPIFGIIVALLSKGANTAPRVVAPAGWYSDPHGQASMRWWDGQTWTEHTHAPSGRHSTGEEQT
jgi:ABC-type dipeptide/oligopeptide/nickel transport system permease component